MLSIAQGLRKREPRTTVFLPSRLRVNADWTDACIHNVSTRGLLVASDRAPEPGAYVEILRGRAVIIGRAVWKKGRFFGVRTQDRIDLTKLQLKMPQSAGRPESAIERRHSDRSKNDINVARALERHQAFSRIFQFALLIIAIGVAASIIVTTVYDLLTAPAQQIEQAMRNQR